MNKQQIEEKLIAIKDTPFKYGNRLWTLKSWEINEAEQKVTLISNGKPITKEFDALNYFIEMLQPISEDKLAAIPKDIATPDLMNVLKDILLDDIQKVREDRGYCQQAKTINNNINTLINLAKFQMAFKK